jgi:hypothetical protein
MVWLPRSRPWSVAEEPKDDTQVRWISTREGLLSRFRQNATGETTRGEIRRRDRLGGLIHEYYRAAA